MTTAFFLAIHPKAPRIHPSRQHKQTHSMKPKPKKAASPQASAIPSQPFNSNPSFNWSDILLVLVVAWAVRIAFMSIVPPGARSFDAFSWETQAGLLKKGLNPYHENALFNWPPFWMQSV